MMSPHAAPSPTLLRGISLLICYTLILSLLALPTPRAARANVSTEYARKMNTPREAAGGPRQPRWRGGELLARFNRGLPAGDVEVLLNVGGLKRAGRLRGQSGVERLRLAAWASPEAAAAALRSSGKVEFAEPNYLITADQVAPSDPRFAEQWALSNDGASGGRFGSDVGAPRGWELSTGSPRTVVAVLDSGVDFTHPELVNNSWANPAELANGLDDDGNGFADDLRGWDFVSNSAEVRDVQGHGTAVAGIIAAEGNNGAGTAGVMWRAGLMSLRVLDEEGTGDVAAAAEAIDYAVTKGAQVINCSWGTDDSSTVLLEAVRRASRRGVIVVASAGNGGRDVELAPRYPASFYGDNLIAVASTDNSDLPPLWSNWGPKHVTVSAPGVDVLTTRASGGYQSVSGSSASAPLVTGVVGLIKTLRPWLGAERTRAMIILGARRVPALSGKVLSGGVVSAAGSLGALDTLAPGEGLDPGGGNNGGSHDEAERGPGAGAAGAGAGGAAMGDADAFTVTPPAPVQGAPRRNLPDLDELRARKPTEPQAQPPAPANRCSHRNPRCQGGARATGVGPAASLPPGRMLAWNLELPDVGGLLKKVSGMVSDSESPLALFVAAPEPLAPPLPPTIPVEDIVWTNTVGVAVTGNSLKKTTATGLWHAGASSTRSIATGDGYVEFTVSETNTGRRFGLNDDDSNQNFPELDYSIHAQADGALSVTESGTNRGSFGTYAVGDTLRVSVEGGSVKYYKNSTLLYTSGVAPAYPLLADTSLYTNGATVTGARISGMLQGNAPAANVVWTNDQGVTPSGNDLTKTAATGWGTAGAVSVETVPFGDCYVEWTASETNLTRTVGLGTGDTNWNQADIAFGFQMSAYGLLYVIEGASNRGNFGAYAAGDHLRISVRNRVVTYWRNGTPLYESALSPTYPLRVDTALYHNGATITGVVLSHEPNSEPRGESYLAARLDPLNRTGRPGVDMLSRNINWNLPIFGLPGRAGLDLGLSLSYNSLVWTKAGSAISFDADSGTISPGFRLGFPVIEAPYYNADVETNAYLLITSSGARVELRYNAATDAYEAADSSYLQLIDNGNGTLLLRDTGGTQYSYSLAGGEYRCVQIKDRNGNYISVTYNPDGQINTITDTLARVLTFNYDATYNSLLSITQMWGPTNAQQAHTWATFGWDNETLDTTFTGLAAVAPPDNSSVRALQWVSFADGTSHHFDYNTRLQVTKTTRKYPYGTAAIDDDKPLSYTIYTLPSSSTDCPRPTQQKVWAKDWNGDDGGTPAAGEEAAIAYTFDVGVSGEALMPDGTRHIELFDATTVWKKGLTVETQVKVGETLMKSTAMSWTQDSTGLSYQKNPRPTTIIITDDAGNSRKTAFSYATHTDPDTGDSFTLPENVFEYGNGTAVKRRTRTEYKWEAAYTSRRIIGLPSTKIVYNGTTATASKVTYDYDEGGIYFVNQGTPTNHDAVGYPATFRAGRGNLTSVMRWDADSPDDATKVIESNIGYNNSGSVIRTRDPLGRQTDINYTDSFSDAARNSLTTLTLAYPTKVTPPLASGETAANYEAKTQYNYDFGAVTEAKGPVPAGQTSGADQIMEYDSVGRVSKVKNGVSNAYTIFVYSPDGTVSTHEQTQPGQTQFNQLVFSTTIFDGAGRPIVEASDNSDAAGDYRGQAIYYDVMGRLSQQSNPAKVNAQWEPYGNDPWPNGDSGNVWTLTLHAYDWKGRPTLTTNPDGTTRSMTYGGCGCIGGETVTTIDEAGRMQKATSDSLGRPWKSEAMSWEDTSGTRTVYSTIKNAYNALDQVTQVSQQVGSSGASQVTTTDYDGYGRVWQTEAPEATAATTFEYFPDGSVSKVTDARGAATNYTYNVRGQVTGISYTAPSGVAATAGAAFAYDPAGNRLWMTDGLGRVDYTYDAQSRMLSETRQFSAMPNRTFPLTYTYTLSGSVKSIEDPFGDTIFYAYDKVERVTGVSGDSFANVTQYASLITYRAWGAAKEVTYSDGLKATLLYNKRLAPAQYELKNASNVLQMGAAYTYYGDGRLKFVDDLREPRFDRQFKYDHVGRVTEAETGYKARDEAYPGNNSQNGPYNHYYNYDQFDHLSSRTGSYWYHESGENYTATYLNNRNLNSGWLYDSDGRVTQSVTIGSSQTYTTVYTYDAAGRRTDAGKYDGDGQRVKSPDGKMYYVRSSVLDALSITEVHSELQAAPLPGTKSSTFVYLGGEAVAEQVVSSASGSTGQKRINWRRQDPAETSVHIHDDSGTLTGSGGKIQMALDIQGIAVEAPDYAKLQQDPSYYDQTYNSYNYGNYGSGYGGGGSGLDSYSSGYGGGGVPGNFGTGCMLEGAGATCDFVTQLWNNGGAHQCPPRGCGARFIDGSLRPYDGSVGGWKGSNIDRPATNIKWERDRVRYTPQQGPSRDLTSAETSTFLDSVVDFLDENPECEKAYNKLLEELRKSTNFDVGGIRDIIKDFRREGILHRHEIKGGTEGWVGWGLGYLAVEMAYNPDSPKPTAIYETFLHEVIHWVGKVPWGVRPSNPKILQEKQVGYYPDQEMSKGWQNLRVVISAEEYRKKNAALIADRLKRGYSPGVDSALAAAGGKISCLGSDADSIRRDLSP